MPPSPMLRSSLASEWPADVRCRPVFGAHPQDRALRVGTDFVPSAFRKQQRLIWAVPRHQGAVSIDQTERLENHMRERRRGGKGKFHDPGEEATQRAIRQKIGEELRARYEASRELPHRIVALLNALETGRKRPVNGQ